MYHLISNNLREVLLRVYARKNLCCLLGISYLRRIPYLVINNSVNNVRISGIRALSTTAHNKTSYSMLRVLCACNGLLLACHLLTWYAALCIVHQSLSHCAILLQSCSTPRAYFRKTRACNGPDGCQQTAGHTLTHNQRLRAVLEITVHSTASKTVGGNCGRACELCIHSANTRLKSAALEVWGHSGTYWVTVSPILRLF